MKMTDTGAAQREALKKIEAWVESALDRDSVIVEATDAGVPASLVASMMGISVPTVARARAKARERGEL